MPALTLNGEDGVGVVVSLRTQPSPDTILTYLSVPSPVFGGGYCQTPSALPGFYDDRLPDPFLFDNGKPVRTMADWSCRRSQISALIKGYEAGDLPIRPPRVSATYSRVNNTGNLTVTAGWGTNTISWSNKITYPNGAAPRRGWPMVVAYDGLSIPVPDGVGNQNLAEPQSI
jgi:hypothetical protein